MALRANDADGYKSWLALGIEQLGRDVAGEVESDWKVPLLVEEERERERKADGLASRGITLTTLRGIEIAILPLRFKYKNVILLSKLTDYIVT